MNELNHWHPVLLSKALKQKPVGIKLCGQEIALFRAENEKIGAVEDSCPHRRMRLSQGWVEGNKLVCPFHGWNYEPDGTGYSPSTPNLKPCAKSFDVLEKHGLIWVKATGSDAQFPNIDFPNYHLVCALEHHVHAPLELLVDTNSEIEHAALGHTFFGHALSQVSEVEVKFDFSDLWVTRLAEKMPQKPLPGILEKLFSVNGSDQFFDRIEIRFSPVYKTSQLYWENEKTGQRRKEQLRSVYFFTPISEQETKWISLYYITSPRWGMFWFNLVQKPILTIIMNHEGNREKQVLESVADKSMELDRMCLGRLDQALIENRKRIQRIYRGQKDTLTKAIAVP
jgi:phenylpropionate dioxygenase-like ring-hydroxylating dioxygenase large terminal subunit